MNYEARNNNAALTIIPSSKRWYFSKTLHSNLNLHKLLKSKKEGNRAGEDGVGRELVT